jgi:hypothetical protein
MFDFSETKMHRLVIDLTVHKNSIFAILTLRLLNKKVRKMWVDKNLFIKDISILLVNWQTNCTG